MNEVVKLLLGGGLIAIVVILLFVSCYQHIRALFSDIVSILASITGFFKKSSTKMAVETACQSTFDKLAKEAPDINLPDLNIKWIGKSDEDVILKDGEAIVFLNYNIDNSQNIINATTAYVKKAVLPQAKAYMASSVKEAIDFTIIRNCLQQIPKHRLMTTMFMQDNTEAIEKNKDSIDKVVNIDEAGLMSRILLREYSEWGNILAGKFVDEKYREESKEFLNFLYNITSREFEEEVPLQFISENIKIGILLVAKTDTYEKYQEKPYIKRIREGFTMGITTFYLLARNEKIEILENVFGRLMESGAFTLINGPKKYKDRQGRENICYCIEIDKEGSMANSVKTIHSAIEQKKAMEAIVSKVYVNEIWCVWDCFDVKIERTQITQDSNITLFNFYKRGTTIEFIPLRLEEGRIDGSLLDTKSNPKLFINNNYSVGAEIEVTIENVGKYDVFMSIPESTTKAKAFRKDLTYNIFTPLSSLFMVGTSLKFTIYNINYVDNIVFVKDTNLTDPWINMSLSHGQELEGCKVEYESETCFVTEITNGIKGILPFSELSWINSEIPAVKHKIERNKHFDCKVKTINQKDKTVILTLCIGQSPYEVLYNSIKHKKITVKAQGVSSSGVLCLYDKKYSIFVPSSEAHIGKSSYNLKRNAYYDVVIVGIAENKKSLIGSLKPFITPPLKEFLKYFSEGQILSHLHPTLIKDKMVGYDIYCKQLHRKFPAYLPIKEISALCHISSLKDIFSFDSDFPLVINKIDLQGDMIELSLKELFKQNKQRKDSLDYTHEYRGYVIGQLYSDYIVIVENVWIEGKIINSSKTLQLGSEVIIRVASRRTPVEFILEK